MSTALKDSIFHLSHKLLLKDRAVGNIGILEGLLHAVSLISNCTRLSLPKIEEENRPWEVISCTGALSVVPFGAGNANIVKHSFCYGDILFGMF